MLAVELQGLSNALRIALDNWGKTHPVYSKHYRTLTREILGVAYAGLEEMPAIKPGMWEIWWMRNHMRFINEFKQRELLLLHEIMYHFLTDFARGRLSTSDERPKEASKRKAKA